jgi:hypothetical protein
LLYSGVRIGDPVALERSRLSSHGWLMLRMERTRQLHYAKLPQLAVDVLAAVRAEGK